MIENGLYEALIQTPAINFKVGDRVFFAELAKGTGVPNIAIQLVSEHAIYSLEGRNQLTARRYQLDIYSDDYFEARDLSRSILALLVPDGAVRPDGFYPFTLPDGTVVVNSLLHINSDFPPEPGVEGVVFRRLLDIEFTFVEAT